MQIFDYFGSILGYILYGIYAVVQNYGLAIIIFTIIVRAAMFPLNVKQQRNTAAMAKISQKQKELQKRYGDDKQKYQEEVQKLYDRENAKPGGGCLTSLIPFPIMLGLYYTVIHPLSNALHMGATAVNAATNMLTTIPGVGTSLNTRYVELEIIKNFDTLKPQLSTIWSSGEIQHVDKFAHSFNFCGLNLLETPWGGSFVLWLIPILCLIFGVGMQVYSMLRNEAMKNQQGCMKFTMLFLPLITAYLALTLPGAVGFYWVVSNALSFVQMIVLNKLYSRDHITANQEARRIARRLQEEKKVREVPEYQRRVVTAETVRNQGVAEPKNNNKNQSKKKKKK